MESLLQEAIQSHQNGEIQVAYKKYKDYSGLHPSNAHVYYLLGAACLHLNKISEAQDALKNSIRLDPEHANSWCCMGHTMEASNKPDEAIKSYKEALKLNPLYEEVCIHLAELYTKGEQWEDAIVMYKKCLTFDPSSTHTHIHLASTLANFGRPEEAKHALKNIIDSIPQDFDNLCLLGKISDACNDLEEAEKYYRKALEIKPKIPEVHYNLGIIFNKQEKPAWALGAFNSAIQFNPGNAMYHFMAGKAASGCMQHSPAVEHFEKAIELNVSHPELNLFYGVALKNAGETRKAIISLQKSILENPNSKEAYCELGHTLRTQKKYNNAVLSFEKALDIDPEYVNALVGISAASRETNEDVNSNMKRALDYALKSTEIAPKDAGVRYNLGNVYMDLGMSKQSIDQHTEALKLDISNVGGSSTSLFNGNYLCDLSGEELYEKHKAWGEEFMDINLPKDLNHTNDPDPNRKLRIGYISPDFCVHPVAYFFKPIMNCHNQDICEIYLYSNNYSDRAEDEYSLLLKEKAHFWMEIQKKTHPEVSDIIQEHEIDILVDLAGHSCGNSLSVLALKPAPIQVSWLGYPNTTGMKAVDYRFTDEVIEPKSLQKISTEEIYHLPNGFNCYAMPYQFPDSAPSPALKNGYITFGSYNNSCKTNQEVIRMWSNILKAVPDSKLILKDKFLRLDPTIEFILSSYENNGISKDRIEILPFSPNNVMHVEEYSKLDIALDPFPYNGTTTTCEALTMGVPIITMLGDRHSARVTGSLVKRAGLHDWVAETEEEYIDIAIKKSADINALAELRSGLRERVLNSSIYNGKLITSDVENAYRDMWKRWCEKQNTE